MFTKQTLVTHEQTVDNIPGEYIIEVVSFISVMKDEGKTDGEFIIVDDHTIKRNWLDQAAVDEWQEKMTALSRLYSVAITNIQVIDALPA